MPAGGGTWGFEFNSTRFAATTTTTANPCDCNDYINGTPPLVSLHPETNGNGQGNFDVTWTSACGAIISNATITLMDGSGNYQYYFPQWSTNNTAFKRATGLSAGNYRVSVQYDGGSCVGETDVIDITIQNQITTTSTTTTTSGKGFFSP